MIQARDLIRGSLRLLGVLSSGEAPSGEEAMDGLRRLRLLLDSWSNEHLLIFFKQREEFDLISGQESYGMGIKGDLDTIRPQKIEEASIQESEGLELPLETLTKEEYARLSLKNTSSSIPCRLYVEYRFPHVVLHLYPKPSESKRLVLYSWKPLSSVRDLNSELEFPPGYERALEYNLALELAPEYGVDPSPGVVAAAMESKSNIKRMNQRPRYLKTEFGNGSWDIRTGSYEF